MSAAAAALPPSLANASGAPDRRAQSSIAYHAEIDGLRALAVGGVIAHHADLGVIPGGFVGVDVFFVISGFLITKLLLAELDRAGRIDLVAFWGRRARRLLPSASLVLLATALLSVVFLPAADLQRAGGDLAAAALYVVNWRFVGAAADYFADTSPSVALHYWSLSVEEQLYLVWPLLLSAFHFLALRRCSQSARRRALALGLAVVAGLSLLYCVLVTRAFQPLGFFDVGARAWQFAFGGLAAVGACALTGRLRAVAAAAGATTILAALALYTDEMLYPGWLAVAPTLGAVLILLSLQADPGGRPFAHRVLASAPMVFLGKISYALYLWHWPMLYFAPQLLPEPLGASPLWPILLSVALAAATHFALENPVRFARALKPRAWASLGVGGAASLAAAGAGVAVVVLAGSVGLEIAPGRRITPEALRDDVTEAYAAGCHLPMQAVRGPECSYGPADAPRTVFLFGDSHAAHWSPAVRAAVEDAGDWRLVHRTKSSCPSMDIVLWNHALNREYAECSAWRDGVLEEIRETRPDLVLIANATIYAPEGPDGRVPAGEARTTVLRQGEEAFMRRLLAAGPGRVVVVADVPRLPDGQPETCLFEEAADAPERCAWRRDEAQASLYPYADYAGFEGVEVLDFADEICDGDRCPAVKNGAVVMRDAGHLSRSFALTLAGLFEPLLASTERSDGRAPG